MCSLGSWTEVNSRARYFGRTNQIRRRCKQTLFSGKKSYVVMWRWRKALASVEIERRTLQRPEAPFVSKTIDRFGRFERALSRNRPLVSWICVFLHIPVFCFSPAGLVIKWLNNKSKYTVLPNVYSNSRWLVKLIYGPHGLFDLKIKNGSATVCLPVAKLVYG